MIEDSVIIKALYAEDEDLNLLIFNTFSSVNYQ